MHHPVTVSDGHSYEHAAIAEWFSRGNRTSPNTGGELPNLMLIPNHALRKVITEWQQAHLLLIPRSALELEEQTGRGSYKVVYRAKLQVAGAPGPMQVAALEIQSGTWATEVDVLLKLGRHPRLVRFIGQCVEEGQKPILVTEFARHGSLAEAFMALQDKEDAEDPSAVPPSPVEGITLPHRIAMLQQICSGMEALAADGMVHGDLAARNVLLFSFDESNVSATSVKVSDFGLAFDTRGGTHATRPGHAMPHLWLPPESLSRRRFSEKSDVWAFGVTAWEIFMANGFVPYYLTPDSEVIAGVIDGSLRLQCPTDCPPRVWEIISGCFAARPAARPTFAQLAVQLGAIESGPLLDRWALQDMPWTVVGGIETSSEVHPTSPAPTLQVHASFSPFGLEAFRAF